MRIDGSVKSITGGVTTLDDKRHSGNFHKVVENWRCDPTKGLVRRPPSLISDRLLPTFSDSEDAIQPFILDNIEYWLVIRDEVVRVFDFVGNEIPVNVLIPTNYLDNLTGSSSLSSITTNNNLYIANKNKEIELLPTEEIRTTNSMIVVKQAPAPFTKIDIQFTASDTIKYDIATITIGDETTDRGTNTVAQLIVDEIELVKPIADLVFIQGSTIAYVREDGVYADITGTDGANDSVIATINSDTNDINNLPKYAPADSVVQIRPDPTSDRGSFWMRATPHITTDDDSVAQWKIDNPAEFPQAILTAERFTPLPILLPTSHIDGYSVDPEFPIGNLVPPGFNGDAVFHLLFINEGPGEDSRTTTIFIRVEGIQPVSNITHMTLIDTVTTEIIVDIPMAGEQIPDEDATVWGAEVNIPRLINGRDYEWYVERLEGIYGPLPEVIWREAADPRLLNHINNNTMPHVLGLRADGEFIYGPMSELGLENVHAVRARQAGDEETNPMPAFIDDTVNDIGRFQDRLVLLSGESVVMSITDKPYAWFRETVTTQLANDPIDIRSGAQNATNMEFILAHNNDALLFTSKAQYKLLGATSMTSANAALPQTTAYESLTTAKPVSNGSDVFFATRLSTTHSGVSRFQVDQISDNQDIAASVAMHVQQLILGDIKLIAASSVLNMVICIGETPNVLYVYEYVDNRTDPQNAWSTWTLPEGYVIQAIRIVQYRIELAVTTDTNALFLLTLPLNLSSVPFSEKVVFLDALAVATGVNTTFNIGNYPWIDEDIKLYQGIDAPNPGNEITGWEKAGNVITVPTDLEGGTVVYGYLFRSTLIPSRRWIRDDSGTPQTASKFRITDYGFHAYGTDINVDILDGPENWPTQVFINPSTEEDAYHRVSFKQRHDEADIEIWTESELRVEILQLEWRGTYFKTGRRF